MTKLGNWVMLTSSEMCQAMEKTNSKALGARRVKNLSSAPDKSYQELSVQQVSMDNASQTDGMGKGVKPRS